MIPLLAILSAACLSFDYDKSSPPLQCWDNIFAPTNLSTVLSGIKSRKHSFTSVIDRYSDSSNIDDNDSAAGTTPPRSVIESALLSILGELGDDDDKSRYLEYWVRDPIKPSKLDAHRDIDEGLCNKYTMPIELGSDIKIGKQRCPNNGHVLYVDVAGTLGSPTLVWNEEGGAGPGPPRELQSMWAVPSVSNRLLRFRGDCLHAVSYPPLSFVKGLYDNDDDENADIVSAAGEDDGGGDYDARRAVILFNTWDEPPLFPPVGGDLFSRETNHYNIISSASAGVTDDELRVAYCQKSSDWIPTPVSCCSRQNCNTASNDTSSNNKLVLLSVPLLGGQSRRGCEAETLDMLVDRAQTEAALMSRYDILGVSPCGDVKVLSS